MKRATNENQNELSPRAAKKAAKKEKRMRHRKRNTILITVMLVLVVAFCAFANADTMPAAEVDAAMQYVKDHDVAVLPEGAVLGDPNAETLWECSDEAMCSDDIPNIVFFDLDDSGFANVAIQYEGIEISKFQEGTVTGIDDTFIECTTPDGCLYSVENKYGLQLGDTVALYFLLSVA